MNKINLTISFSVLLMFLFTSCEESPNAAEKKTKSKSIESSETLKEVTIGDQVWMAENLNVDKFRNGDPIPQAKTVEDWIDARENGEPAWSYYNHEPANGEKYGKLYNWYAVNDSRGLAPEGWRIPSDKDWDILADYLGGDELAGEKMKSEEGWLQEGNGTNESGFTGLPGGFHGFNETIAGIEEGGDWWTSTEVDSTSAQVRGLVYLNKRLLKSKSSKSFGLSVRCIKD